MSAAIFHISTSLSSLSLSLSLSVYLSVDDNLLEGNGLLAGPAYFANYVRRYYISRDGIEYLTSSFEFFPKITMVNSLVYIYIPIAFNG